MEVPPVMFTFVLEGPGEEVREVGVLFEVLKSEIRVPAAEGGARGVGAWMAAGLGWRVKALFDVDVLAFWVALLGAAELEVPGFLVTYSSSFFLIYAVPCPAYVSVIWRGGGV